MGYLTNKTVYLAGPVHRDADNGAKWRNYVTTTLEDHYECTVLDPCKMTLHGVGEVGDDKKYFVDLIVKREYAKVKEEFYKVIRKDLRAVDKSDFLIVYHDPLVPTIGTIHEIVNAINSKKPVLIYCDKRLIEKLNPWILTLIKPQWLFNEWDELWGYLTKIDKGDLDSSHWW